MADRNIELKVRITAQLNELRAGLDQLNGRLDQLGKNGQKAGQQASRGVSGLEGALTKVRNVIGTVASAYAALQGARTFIRLADEARLLESRLKLVTNGTEEFAAAQALLFDVAQRTRTSLSETVNLYSRIATATKELGVSQGELLQVTETINQAVQLSGASAEAANAALVQLGQGLASGTLRGEELNSVLEQTPRLARAIAEGLGVTVGELRKLGQDGKITAEQILNALQAQKDIVDGEFRQLPVTVAGAFTQLKNSVLVSIGQIDKAIFATSGLASVIQDLSDFLDSGVLQAGIADFAVTWIDAIANIVSDIGVLIDTLGDLFSDLENEGGSAVDFITDAFKNLPANIRAFLQIIVVEAAAIFDRVIADARGFRDIVAAIFTDDTVEAAIGREIAAQEAISQARKDSIEAILSERQASIDKGKAAADAIRKEREERQKLRQQALSPGKRTGTGGGRGGNAGGAVDEFELLKAGIQRELAEIERAYRESELSAAGYYRRRRDLQLKALDAEIAQQNAALNTATTADARSKALTQIAILQGQRQDIIKASNREQQKAEEDLQSKLTDLRARALAGEGQIVEARKLELEAEFKDLLARLKVEGDAAGIKLVEGLINTELAEAKIDQLQDQIAKVTGRFDQAQQNAANRVATGDLSQGAAQTVVQGEASNALGQLQGFRSELEALAGQEVPGAKEALDELDRTMQTIGQSAQGGVAKAIQDLRLELANLQQSFAGDTIGALRDGLTGLFTSLVDGSKSAGDALRDFVRGFALQMAQLAARALATALTLKALEAVTGIPAAALAGGGGGGGGGLFGSLFHGGGVVGRDRGVQRRVPGFVFAGAPRLHEGGIAGLKTNEVPAILERGEEVLSKSDPRNSLNGGGAAAGGNGTRIINVIDPNLVQDYMTSAAGERTLVNVIQRNAGSIKQVLA